MFGRTHVDFGRLRHRPSKLAGSAHGVVSRSLCKVHDRASYRSEALCFFGVQHILFWLFHRQLPTETWSAHRVAASHAKPLEDLILCISLGKPLSFRFCGHAQLPFSEQVIRSPYLELIHRLLLYLRDHLHVSSSDEEIIHVESDDDDHVCHGRECTHMGSDLSGTTPMSTKRGSMVLHQFWGL